MENITLDRCCIHTITTKPWGLSEAVENYAAAGVKGISVWQNDTEGIGPLRAGEIIRAAGLEIVSYVRGGFFPHTSSAGRAQAIDHNRKLLEEAAQGLERIRASLPPKRFLANDPTLQTLDQRLTEAIATIRDLPTGQTISRAQQDKLKAFLTLADHPILR